ncbi:winged helix-turn-helix transcriptional regulator [Thermus scotoductus]|uniref:winged helix-turn-helix transcriptional regulator n=1 Tax=Thermus scotoductus TaxID=37636 RepID=UPI000F7E726A|nr:hypothetical protein [Thermus scotoductus]
MPGSDEWRYDAFSGEWLTTGDVARRLGLSPGTVRHYAEVLRERGYPLRQGEEGEWLWPPEVVELVRVAYHAARCLSPRLSLEDMLDLLERTATYTLTRRGETLHDLVARGEAGGGEPLPGKGGPGGGGGGDPGGRTRGQGGHGACG